jgi:hypothetical protein
MRDERLAGPLPFWFGAGFGKKSDIYIFLKSWLNRFGLAH